MVTGATAGLCDILLSFIWLASFIFIIYDDVVNGFEDIFICQCQIFCLKIWG